MPIGPRTNPTLSFDPLAVQSLATTRANQTDGSHQPLEHTRGQFVETAVPIRHAPSTNANDRVRLPNPFLNDVAGLDRHALRQQCYAQHVPLDPRDRVVPVPSLPHHDGPSLRDLVIGESGLRSCSAKFAALTPGCSWPARTFSGVSALMTSPNNSAPGSMVWHCHMLHRTKTNKEYCASDEQSFVQHHPRRAESPMSPTNAEQHR